MAEPPSGTVTLLFSDIEGSTRLLERTGGDAYAGLLKEHRRLLGQAFDHHDGFHVGSEGDSFFVAFASADDAAGAAGAGPRAPARPARADDAEIPVRMGLHSRAPRLFDPGYVRRDAHPAGTVNRAR